MKQKMSRKKLSKEVYTKAILMGASSLLLVAALVFFTVAWYTKMVSTAGINLQAAQWDFTANHTVDSVSVNVYEYASMEKGRAAPGTGGQIPILLGARQSDTDIQYTLTVDRSSMSKDFRDRVYFYYYQEAEEEGGERQKVYFGASPAAPDSDTERVIMEGTIPHGSTAWAYVYWEWVYDADDINRTMTELEKEAWDTFDTRVGENPDAFTADMNASITITGVEVKPSQTTASTGNQDG